MVFWQLCMQLGPSRKERKVFEAYQQEARAGRDKKDKEDIENLRRAVSDLQLVIVFFP